MVTLLNGLDLESKKGSKTAIYPMVLGHGFVDFGVSIDRLKL